jgi:hypothetical protein
MNNRVTTLRSTTQVRDHQGQRGRFAQAKREWPADQEADRRYSGDERRQQNRRQADRPTTLDTRKAGPERRTTGRISLKV